MTVKQVQQKLLDDVELRGWQQEIVDIIERHESARESEQYQGLAEYTVNKSLGVYVVLPRYSGHTFLSNYIASKYPTLLVYGTMGHYKTVTERFPLHPNTETVSMYEVFYAAYKPSKHQPTTEFLELKRKFSGKQVVVIDNAASIPNDLLDLVYNNAGSAVVCLGH